MYVGHAGIALAARKARPQIPIALLIPVAFAPDWIDWLLAVAGVRNPALSHSLVSVGIGAALCGIVYLLWRRDAASSVVVFLTYASHWPADFITAVKPTWPGGPDVGLNLYSYTLWDVVVESALAIVCWLVYRKSLPEESRYRAVSVLIPLGLIGMQILFAAIRDPGLSL